MLGRRHDAAVTKATHRRPTRSSSGPCRASRCCCRSWLVGGLALLPHLGVVLTSVSRTGAWYQSALPRAFTARHYADALPATRPCRRCRRSVEYASISTGVDLVLGLAIAFLVVRSKLPRLVRQAVDSMAMLPLAVPGLVMAFGYLAISARMQVRLKDWPQARTPVRRAREPDAAAGDGVRHAAAAVRGAERRRRAGADAGRPGAGRPQPGRERRADAAEDRRCR